MNRQWDFSLNNFYIVASVTRLGNLLDSGQLFQSLWQQLNCPNLPHSYAILVKVSNSIIFLVKSILGNFYRHLVIFSGHTDCGVILALCVYVYEAHKLCYLSASKLRSRSRRQTSRRPSSRWTSWSPTCRGTLFLLSSIWTMQILLQLHPGANAINKFRIT